MNIALIATNDEPLSADIIAFVAASEWDAPRFERWQLAASVCCGEQALPQLEEHWQRTRPEIVIFPAGITGDELATRLAWRTGGVSVCQAQAWHSATRCVSKAVYGNALTARLAVAASPLCLSVALAGSRPSGAAGPQIDGEDAIPVGPLPEGLQLLSETRREEIQPLSQARRVVAFGQGGECLSEDEMKALAKSLGAEAGYTRQRVMLGGVDDARMIGVSGQMLAPELCIIAGASGAAAFSAGIAQSQFIVAINTDADAPLFAQADVGIVDDGLAVLRALAALS